MTTITGLNGATGAEWYSWPVGTPVGALDEVARRFTDDTGLCENASASITALDHRLSQMGAAMGGVWAPPQMAGLITAQWWAGILVSPDDSQFRSARRYERIVSGRDFDGVVTVYDQDLQSLYVDDMEAILTIETRGSGDETQPYIFARAVYFPLWTTARPILEAACPVFTQVAEFAAEITAIASSLHILTSNTETRTAS
ncbi:MAG: hypothetical protein FWF25_00090 [Propionibacteriaceae bacterium]|nr:hypothetical protein [Propionibacteriaceae bacterium]